MKKGYIWKSEQDLNGSYFYTQNQGEINMGAVLAFVAGTAVGIVVMCLIQIKR